MNNVYEILLKLKKEKDLKILSESGVISPTVIKFMEIYYFFNSEMLTGKQKKRTVITFTAEELKVSERTVYKAIKVMESKGRMFTIPEKFYLENR